MDTATPILAVLAGDLVASSALSAVDLDRAIACLADTAQRIAPWAGGDMCLTRNRGDGWQAVVRHPSRDLRAALSFSAAMMALGPEFATRIALARGTGSVTAPDLNQASGQVFVTAGKTLDAMPAPARLIHAHGGALGAAVRLSDAIAQSWTPTQARTIAPMLVPDPPTHATVAKDLGVSRQAVSKALDAALLDVLSEALALIEETP